MAARTAGSFITSLRVAADGAAPFAPQTPLPSQCFWRRARMGLPADSADRTRLEVGTLALCTGQHRHARQPNSSEKLQRGAAARRDVRNAVGDARLRHRGNRVAASDDRRSVHPCDCLARSAIVPVAKASISKTPIGPFHTTVLASASSGGVLPAIVCGPMSRPIRVADRVVVHAQRVVAVPASAFSATR